MRYKDLIDITINDADEAAVVAALLVLEEKLPLIGLTKREIRRMAKFGQKNETFVMEAIEAGKNNPSLIPPNVKMDAVERDRKGRAQLAMVAQRVQKLNEKLEHTRMALGADLFGAARAIYKSLQEFGPDAGVSDLLGTLGRRFRGQGKKKTTPEVPSTPSSLSGGVQN